MQTKIEVKGIQELVVKTLNIQFLGWLFFATINQGCTILSIEIVNSSSSVSFKKALYSTLSISIVFIIFVVCGKINKNKKVNLSSQFLQEKFQ